jgi:hypothetical protein
LLRAAGRLAQPVVGGLAAAAPRVATRAQCRDFIAKTLQFPRRSRNWHEIGVSERQIGEKMQKELTARAPPHLRAGCNFGENAGILLRFSAYPAPI